MAFGWRLHECKHALILVTTWRLLRAGLGVPAGGSSAHFEQRVLPLMALAGQSLHRPSSLRRCRSSVASTRLSSRFCSSVRRGFAGLVADLWLAVPARVLRPGLVCFGFLGRVSPELAGLGRMKVNWNVLPITRVRGVSDPTTGIRV